MEQIGQVRVVAVPRPQILVSSYYPLKKGPEMMDDKIPEERAYRTRPERRLRPAQTRWAGKPEAYKGTLGRLEGNERQESTAV